MSRAINKEQKLQRIIETEKSLNEIQDFDVLLERILTEARKIVNADAGSIYVVDGSNLKIKYAQNDTHLKELMPGEKLPYTFFSFPIDETSIAGYVASTRQFLNIGDAYLIPDDRPYRFNIQTDKTTDYRTKSILTFPLKMANGILLGVLQIINAQDESGRVIEFDKDAELYVTHFATSAEQALGRAYLTNNTVKRMLKMAEFRDPKETYAHAERVSSFALEIYDRWAFIHNIPDEELHRFRDTLKVAAKFHDVGKVGVSDVILKKTTPGLTDEERAVMQGHTCIGASLFDPPFSYLDEMSRDIALHHHERWDGGPQAYPGRCDFRSVEIGGAVPPGEPLRGTEIPLAARIVAVADVFDALSHKRSYKEAWGIDKVFMTIQNDAGKHFDPEIVSVFMQIRDRICSILMAYPDAE